MNDQAKTRWQQLAGDSSGTSYAERFAALAASGHDVHGEATFCHALLGRPGRVLDAGCGTGRVAVRLSALGHTCTGLDVDASMLAVARTADKTVTWVAGDLAALPGEVTGPFDLVVLVGNVVPLLAAGTLPQTVAGLVATPGAGVGGPVLRRVAPGESRKSSSEGLWVLVDAAAAPDGLLVAGFGLDAKHLPKGCPVTPVEEYDDTAAACGLEPVDRFSTWDQAPDDPAAGYAVSVHRRR